MKKYFTPVLLCMICIFVAIGLASVIAVAPTAVVFMNTSSAKIRDVSSELIRTAISFVVIYIAMRRNGYGSNKAYEKKSIKELLIPIIISVILLMILNIATNFFFANTCGFTFTLVAFFTNADFNMWGSGSLEYIFENYYFILLLSAILQSITYAFFMFLGFVHGYKKREKARKEITSNKND